MTKYQISFSTLAEVQFLKLDKSIKERISKRIQHMTIEPTGRHLHHGLGFFVIGLGQYRIVYKVKNTIKVIFFVGNHKEYEKWFRSTND